MQKVFSFRFTDMNNSVNIVKIKKSIYDRLKKIQLYKVKVSERENAVAMLLPNSNNNYSSHICFNISSLCIVVLITYNIFTYILLTSAYFYA